MSLALARKYRPKTFTDVAVQTHVSNTLRGAIARGRVAHGYLLCGPRGTGKTTLARVLAMALNCENRPRGGAESPSADPGEPCGICDSCRRIWSGASSLDVVEIDAASNRGVEDARDLRERAMYAPSGESRWKVYIIDEAHMLTREAWNALLKVLEEPPPRVVFVFATTEPHRIAQFAAPVLSRLQRFDFRRIGIADIRARLDSVLRQEQVAAEPDALAMIARAADGSMRDALSLTDQVIALGGQTVTAEHVRQTLGLVAEDEYLAFLDIIADRRAADVFPAISRLVDAGVDLGVFLSGFSEMVRAMLAVNLDASAGDVSDRVRAGLVERKGRLATGDLLRMLNALAELEPRFRRSTQQQLLLETALVRFALLDRTITLERLLRDLADAPGPAVSPSDPGSARGAPGPREGHQSGRSEKGGGGVGGRGAGGARQLAPPTDSPVAVPRLSDVPAALSGTRARMPTPSAPWITLSAASDEVQTLGDERAEPGDAAATVHVADLNAIAAAWDDLVASVRRARPLIATLLEHALPTAASATGTLTILVDSETVHEGLKATMGDTISLLRSRIAGLQRIVVRCGDESGEARAASRMTAASVRSDTLTSMRKRDPVLAAAIDALDLELAD